MRIPNAFQGATPLLGGAAGGALFNLAPVQGPGWEILDCPMTQQEKTEWCWAAVTQAVERRHQVDDSQCNIARELIPSSCGSTCTAAACNSPQALSEILSLRKRLRQPPVAPLTIQQVRDEIQNRGEVVCCHLERGKIDHFVIICGYSDSTGKPRIAILDPAMTDPQPQAHDFAQFLIAYEGGGRWDEAYLTK